MCTVRYQTTTRWTIISIIYCTTMWCVPYLSAFGSIALDNTLRTVRTTQFDIILCVHTACTSLFSSSRLHKVRHSLKEGDVLPLFDIFRTFLLLLQRYVKKWKTVSMPWGGRTGKQTDDLEFDKSWEKIFGFSLRSGKQVCGKKNVRPLSTWFFSTPFLLANSRAFWTFPWILHFLLLGYTYRSNAHVSLSFPSWHNCAGDFLTTPTFMRVLRGCIPTIKSRLVLIENLIWFTSTIASTRRWLVDIYQLINLNQWSRNNLSNHDQLIFSRKKRGVCVA